MSVLVYGDKERLEQVVSNLLTNAIKYSPEADEVILEVSEENRSLKISVTDFGIGIPEDIQKYLFDRFFRVEQNSHQFQGLGIGLYICAEVVKRHEGTINVESTKGKGSTFFFTIPLPEK
jgi:two-component system CheB/CheR fusion protein